MLSRSEITKLRRLGVTMGRSGYTEDYEYLDLYRRAVKRAIEGIRGQLFLRELAQVLDDMPVKRLIDEQLINDAGEVCTIGAVCKARHLDTLKIYADDPDSVASAVGIARSLAAEIVFLNDEWGGRSETPEDRWLRMRAWVGEQLK